MNSADIFYLERTQITPDELIPLADILNKEEYAQQKTNILGLLKTDDTAEIKNKIDSVGLELEDLYYCESSLTKLCYFNDLVLVFIYSFDKEFFKVMNPVKIINQSNKTIKEIIGKGDFVTLFECGVINEKIQFYAFKKLYKQIPNKLKYPVFRRIYTHHDYFFEYLGMDFIKEIIEYKNKSNGIGKTKDYINIYRGEGEKSMCVDKTISWTLNFTKALFFATRFNGNGKIYKAKVKMCNVIDYITTRGEDEILVFPENVENIEELKQLSIEDLSKEQSILLLSEYNKYKNVIRKGMFNDGGEGIHGIRHTRRVLFLCILLGVLKNLRSSDIELLAFCAQYHDVSRVHDNEDEFHGLQSYAKIERKGLIEQFEGDDSEIVRYLIENHCIDDKKAELNIKAYNITNTERARNLFNIFKDSDGLDRVRLGDLDIKYLRNDISVQCASLAYKLLSEI